MRQRKSRRKGKTKTQSVSVYVRVCVRGVKKKSINSVNVYVDVMSTRFIIMKLHIKDSSSYKTKTLCKRFNLFSNLLNCRLVSGISFNTVNRVIA